MVMLSKVREDWPILDGLELLNRGKVRDTYRISDKHRLIVVTDAISVFDNVLNSLVLQKGIILNALSHFWFKKMDKEMGIENHVMATGSGIDEYLPENLRGDVDLQARAMVVMDLSMLDAEFIGRGNLTGSGWDAYQKTGEVCGHKLPKGLSNGDSLDSPLDTPTTKAIEGHDEHLSAAEISKKYPEATELLLKIFNAARQFASAKGIIIADTKFEFGVDQTGKVILADEVLTPDSSRFWNATEWRKSREAEIKTAPSSMDKETVRQFCKKMGIKEMTPEEAIKFKLPKWVVKNTTQIYRYIFWRLTGYILEDYLQQFMGVSLPWPKKKVAVILGSENDLPYVDDIIRTWKAGNESGQIRDLAVHVISCHRNPEKLREWAEKFGKDYDLIIGAGGKAFAMPGVLDAWLYHFHHEKGIFPQVIGVALGPVNVTIGKKQSKALQAAILSIDEIPGQPVLMNELREGVYTGTNGFKEAFERVDLGEFMPGKPRKRKDPKFDIEL